MNEESFSNEDNENIEWGERLLSKFIQFPLDESVGDDWFCHYSFFHKHGSPPDIFIKISDIKRFIPVLTKDAQKGVLPSLNVLEFCQWLKENSMELPCEGDIFLEYVSPVARIYIDTYRCMHEILRSFTRNIPMTNFIDIEFNTEKGARFLLKDPRILKDFLDTAAKVRSVLGECPGLELEKEIPLVAEKEDKKESGYPRTRYGY